MSPNMHLLKMWAYFYKMSESAFTWISGVGFTGIFQNLYTNNLRTGMDILYIASDNYLWG